MGDHPYSTQNISSKLMSEVKKALKNKHYGSIEIYIQDYKVTQITERTIQKLDKEKSGREKTGS